MKLSTHTMSELFTEDTAAAGEGFSLYDLVNHSTRVIATDLLIELIEEAGCVFSIKRKHIYLHLIKRTEGEDVYLHYSYQSIIGGRCLCILTGVLT